MTIELYATDFVFLKDGKPMEGLDCIYTQQSLDELLEHGFEFQEGEEFMAMTALPLELQAKYIEAITEMEQ